MPGRWKMWEIRPDRELDRISNNKKFLLETISFLSLHIHATDPVSTWDMSPCFLPGSLERRAVGEIEQIGPRARSVPLTYSLCPRGPLSRGPCSLPQEVALWGFYRPHALLLPFGSLHPGAPAETGGRESREDKVVLSDSLSGGQLGLAVSFLDKTSFSSKGACSGPLFLASIRLLSSCPS